MTGIHFDLIVKHDILLIIRSYLVRLNPFYVYNERKELYYYIEIEGQRSWRNFLAIRKCDYSGDQSHDTINQWIEMVKATRILNLNRIFSKLYLKNPAFRESVLTAIVDPSKQLLLDFSEFGLRNLSDIEANVLSGVYSLNLTGNNLLTDLPHLTRITYLNISNCRALRDISKLANITHLNILYCNSLLFESKSEVQVPKFSSSLHSIKLQPQAMDCLLNFTNLLELHIVGLTHSLQVLSLCSIYLHQLEKLVLRGSFRDTFIVVPNLPFPNLRWLDTYDVNIESISNLSKLENLVILEAKIENGFESLQNLQVFKGAFELFTILVSKGVIPKKSCILHDFNFEKYEEYTNLWHNLTSLEFINPIQIQNFSIPPTLKSLTISDCESLIEVNHLTSPKDSLLHFIDLSFTSIVNVQFCSSLEKVILTGCVNIIDVSPLIYVKYLNLSRCVSIVNLNVLGKYQHFLDVSGCHQLIDEDLPSFSDVRLLKISSCERITNLSPLRENLYLFASNCDGLISVSLYGYQYVKVDLSFCSQLASIIVHGEIFQLEICKTRFLLNPSPPEKVKSIIHWKLPSIFQIE